jgi:hypothetical protein
MFCMILILCFFGFSVLFKSPGICKKKCDFGMYVLILEARTRSRNSLQRALKADTFQLSWVFRIPF